MNAIDRIRTPLALHLSMAASGEQPTAQSLASLDDGLAALAAVETLLQAAEALDEELVKWSEDANDGEFALWSQDRIMAAWLALAAAVRNVKGEA